MLELRETLARHGISCQTLRRLEDVPEEVWLLTTPGGEPAISLWERLRALVPETGFWPVLLGDPDDLERIQENVGFAEHGSAAEILQAASRIDPHELLREWEEERAADAEDEEDELPHYRGDWPEETVPSSGFAIPFDYKQQPHPLMWMALLPTRASVEAPAYLRFGDWNACPAPERHLAMLRRWDEIFGIEVVGMDADTIEVRALRPPQTRVDALRLAWEQFLYCPDIVEQGTETVENLAATLLNGTTWFFWWD